MLQTLRDIVGVREAGDLKQIVGMVRLSFGLCMPKSCSADTIQTLWNHLEYTFGLQGHLSVDEDFCTYRGKIPFKFPFDGLILYAIFYTNTKPEINTKTIFRWGFVCYILLLCLATVYDFIILKRKRGKYQISFETEIKNMSQLFAI